MTKETVPQPVPMPFELVTLVAREMALRDGGHVPTLIIDGSDGPVFMLIDSLAPSHGERIEQMFFAGATLAREGHVGRLRQVFFISEAWLSTARDGSLPSIPPSQDPNRKEVLIISGYMPRTQQTNLALLEMIRDHDGALRELREFERFQNGEEDVKSPLLIAFVKGFFSRTN